ncbi:OprD family porin [Hymenobacter sp. 5317J-9]|uniref:OprD family outer membrane porin n=1 Tax=Hymenobacter sp. 5317J-9 TaxID=2932250 RepID=UPI001FD6E9A0|nr:OprD family outer membrane porin [Hymenobacter sp. 5317J-9]UOQ96665.1 OprD family porin [Hymenobacter sp. 5317J-9]
MSRFARLLGVGLLLAPAAAWAQQAEPALTRPVTGRTQLAPYPAPASADTVRARTLAEALGRGRWYGRLRNNTMATWNRGHGPDYFANGLGTGLRFETAPWHGVQVGAGGFAWASVGSDNLLTADAATGAVSRYEVGLFDVTNPSRRQLAGRAEELFVRYRFRQSVLTFGRQLLNTPLLNAHDGRLSPGYAQGLWLEFRELPGTTITGGWLTHIGPRSTAGWYSVANSVGLYPMGVTDAGLRASYAGHLRSRGLGVLAVSRQWGPRTTAQAWNYYADNLFNAAFAELTTGRAVGAGRLSLGAQVHYQRTVGTGGNPNPHLAYSAPGRQAQALSARLGYQRGPWNLSANYTRISRSGRFLFPREWGREPFYTFLPRERTEGLGGLDAAALLGSYTFARVPGLKAEVGYGHYYLPDVRDTRLNKYGLPSYQQLNASLTYPFAGWARGLRGQLLYVYKGALGETYGEARYVVNKVDFQQLNLILNYEF